MVPAVAGAVRFWLPELGSWPRLDQIVPLPCCAVQCVVLLEVQLSVMDALGATWELVGAKLLIVGTVGGVKLQALYVPLLVRTVTLPVCGSMRTALTTDDVVSAIGETWSRETVCAWAPVVHAAVSSRDSPSTAVCNEAPYGRCVRINDSPDECIRTAEACH